MTYYVDLEHLRLAYAIMKAAGQERIEIPDATLTGQFANEIVTWTHDELRDVHIFTTRPSAEPPPGAAP